MGSSTDDVEVLDLPDEHRFVIRRGGAEAELVYRIDGDTMVIAHTEVPESLGGQGVGADLVTAALAKAATHGLTVVPRCPFARRFLQRHPDQAASVTIDWSRPSRTVRPDREAHDAGQDSAGQHAELDRHVDEQEEESFPASDPHSDWAGTG
jgi:predicted GNAT family acetyltransferase